MAAARLAGNAKVLLPAKIRQLQTLVYVGTTNSKDQSTLLASLFTDDDSRVGRILASEVMRLRNAASHRQDYSCSTSRNHMDLCAQVADDEQPTQDPSSIKEDLKVVAQRGQCSGWRIDFPTFWSQREGYDNKKANEVLDGQKRAKRHAEEAAARFRDNHRFDQLEGVVNKGFKHVLDELKPVKRDLASVRHVIDLENQEAKEYRMKFDTVKASVDFLRKQEEIRAEAALKDKLWIYRMIDLSVTKLPWGLPIFVKVSCDVYANVLAVYPVAFGTYLYLRYSINPVVYFELSFLYHDEMMEPYVKKIEQLQLRGIS
ncbi:uncharacterized protein LOC123452628 [Hordeum vulgare subsp. vulgare]|uniref:uncharacterized protein LOC123452628 n=1 Tax=Hordeum vulgare subsp. vulgare TaxID=112509 RepID=UPI001D1A5417|nr:uncharacterized protein LOC123452628 [Hordeum vulgare subsp. vulgare]